MKNFYILQDIFMKFNIDYYLRQSYNFRKSFSDRTTIAYSCHTNCPIKIKSLYEKLFYLTRYRHGSWHRLFSKATLQYLKKLFRSDHYSIWLSYKLTAQNQVKDFLYHFMHSTPVKNVIALV